MNMVRIENTFEGIGMPTKKKAEPGDYTDGEGFLICGKCNTRRQTLGGSGRKVFCLCKCGEEKRDAEERQRASEERERNIKRLRKDGITDPRYLRFTFANDDRRNAELSVKCERYVEKWDIMKQKNYGLLFYGTVGTGKSFFAGCIANALLEKEVSVVMTSLPRIIGALQGATAERRESTLEMIQHCDLLILDDFGVEALTEYRLEQSFMIFDARQRSEKPLIVTSNIAPDMMAQEERLAIQRIYDRVLGMCPGAFRMTGDSRRTENAEKARRDLRELLDMK